MDSLQGSGAIPPSLMVNRNFTTGKRPAIAGEKPLPEVATVSPGCILAAACSPTKIRTEKATVPIWLPVSEKGKRKSHSTWVSFNAVVDMALLTGRPKLR
jgi:hypothetical protein